MGEEIYAAGDDGTALRWGQSEWSAPWNDVPALELADVWASSAEDAVAAGNGFETDGRIFRWDGTAWKREAISASPSRLYGAFSVDDRPLISALWGSSPDNVLAIGNMGIVRRTPQGWGSFASPPPVPEVSSVPTALTGNGPDDIFAFGAKHTPLPNTVIWRWSGNAWSSSEVDRTTLQAWSAGPNAVFTVGVELATPTTARAVASRWDGSSWSVTPLGIDTTVGSGIGVWGTGAKDVYVAGSAGFLARWDGSAWTELDSGTKQDLATIGGTSAADAFAAGDRVLMHRRGGRWFPIHLPVTMAVRRLAASPGRVFLVGPTGELHLDRPTVNCSGPEERCSDGWDNDCDGRSDGDDPDCAGKVSEACADLIDDDGDGKIDCDDPGCAMFPSCKDWP
jgi:hypothetical protein